MHIDPAGHVPIYLQIAAGVRAALATGVYRPGDMLPSLRRMATEIHVNPNTVQRAYDELERDGLIYSQRGKGLFVAEQATAFAQSHTGDGVRRAFDETIRAGRTAGMSVAQMREIFQVAMEGIIATARDEGRGDCPDFCGGTPREAGPPQKWDCPLSSEPEPSSLAPRPSTLDPGSQP